MSALGTPPSPTPGTWPLLRRGRRPRLRPFREDPAIARENQTSGRTVHSDEARRARVDAVAHDLAAIEPPDDGPLRPALRDELLATIRANVAAAAAAGARDRATANEAAEKAEIVARNAAEAEREAERAVRRTRSEVPDQPVGGGHLAWPWLPLLVAPVLIYLEREIGAPPLAAALDTSPSEAKLVALAIALGLTLAADGLGLVLAGLARDSRRATAVVLGIFVFGIVGCGAWSVASLAASRGHNFAYKAAISDASAPFTPGVDQLGSLSRGGSATAPQAQRSTTAQAIEARVLAAGPDLRFMVPLILLSMLAGALLAARASLAADWRERVRRARAAEREHAAAQTVRRTADEEQRRALEALIAADVELMALAERETATVTGLLDRFRTEYERWCARLGTRPRHVGILPLPPPRALLESILYPDHVWYELARPPAEGWTTPAATENGASDGRPPGGGTPPSGAWPGGGAGLSGSWSRPNSAAPGDDDRTPRGGDGEDAATGDEAETADPVDGAEQTTDDVPHVGPDDRDTARGEPAGYGWLGDERDEQPATASSSHNGNDPTTEDQ